MPLEEKSKPVNNLTVPSILGHHSVEGGCRALERGNLRILGDLEIGVLALELVILLGESHLPTGIMLVEAGLQFQFELLESLGELGNFLQNELGVVVHGSKAVLKSREVVEGRSRIQGEKFPQN